MIPRPTSIPPKIPSDDERPRRAVQALLALGDGVLELLVELLLETLLDPVDLDGVFSLRRLGLRAARTVGFVGHGRRPGGGVVIASG